MKKIFISILLFFMGFHFILPLIYYKIFGVITIYTYFYDKASATKAILLNIISISATILIILFLPDKKRKIEPKYNYTNLLFYIAAIYSIYFFMLAGNYAGIRSGSLLGSIYMYIKIFLDIGLILFVVLFYQRKRINIFIIVIVFVLLQTYFGSRSAVISLILLLLFFPIYQNYDKYKRKIKKIAVLIIILSPMLFFFATWMRGRKFAHSIWLVNTVIGRISMIESSMLPIYYKSPMPPIYYKDDKDREHSNIGNLDIFYEKYSLLNQFKLSFNSLFPGAIFKEDVDPNQYYRTAFLDVPEDVAKKYYTSINITFPVYVYMYSNFGIAILISILVYIMYYFILLLSKNYIYFFIPLLVSLYGFLYFFDFVMYFRQLLFSMLTIFAIILFEKFGKILKNTKIILINNNIFAEEKLQKNEKENTYIRY